MAFPDIEIDSGTTFAGARLYAKDADGAVVPLAGYSAYAQVRKTPNHPDVIYNLNPTIAADDSAGLITIPAIAWDDTKDIASANYVWDCIVVTPTGERHKIIPKAAFRVGKLVTDPEDTQ